MSRRFTRRQANGKVSFYVLLVTAVTSAVLAGGGAWAASLPAGPAGAQRDVPVLVSTQWVADHLDDPGVLLLHVAMLMSGAPTAFIPGAAVLDYHAIETSQGLAIELPTAEQLASVFGAAGVSSDRHVVLYGGGAAHIAARAFFTLEYLGQRRVSVMDGGIEAWQQEGRPTVTRAAAPAPAHFVPAVDTDILADAAWIRARLDDANVAVIDARPPGQFAGSSNRDLREGHIPGAGNLYFVELLESENVPRLKPRDEVEALFAAAGFHPGATVVSYCQIGMRASYNYLIARHLGYDVRLYDGSWQEWGADPSLPAETGPARR